MFVRKMIVAPTAIPAPVAAANNPVRKGDASTRWATTCTIGKYAKWKKFTNAVTPRIDASGGCCPTRLTLAAMSERNVDP